MRTAKAIAQSLLDVDRERNLVLVPNVKLSAFVLAMLNLLPSGLSENYLRNDTTGYYLSLFLFCHAALYCLLSLVYYVGSSRDILGKTQIYPTNAMGRFSFAIFSSLRHPFSIGLLASNAFFFLVVFRNNIETAAILIIAYLLLMMCIATVTAFVFLFLERRRMPAHAALIVAGIFVSAMLVMSVVFHAGSSSLIFGPLIDLIVRGILSSEQGDLTHGALACVVLLATIGIAFIAGRRLK